MKNIKKLLAVVLTVILLASMIVPALAAVENAEKGIKLQAIGLMAGGINDLKLDEGLNRIQGLTFAIRAAGKEAEALGMSNNEVESILANVVDRSSIPNWANGYAQKYVAYAVKHKYTLGTDSTILPKVRFGPMDSISGTSFLVFLMKSGMGYGSVTTKNVIEEAMSAKIITTAEAVKYGSKTSLIRDDAAGILYGAAMNGVNADGKKLIESLIESGFVKRQDAINAGFIIEEVDTLTMSVKAIGARKLEIQFNNAVDSSKASIDVKRGTTSPLIKSITFSDDKKSAVIELSADMVAGEYTVTVSGLTSAVLTAGTTVTNSRLTTIRFLSDVAVKKGNDITVTVVGENQYGEDVTYLLNSASVWASSGTGQSIQNGVVTVKGTSPNYFTTNQMVTVTIVESTAGVTASEALKVADSATIESIVLGEISTDDVDLKDKDVNAEAMAKYASKYYLPITVKDQYGNVLKADDLNNLQIYTSDPSIIKLAATPLINHSEKGTVLKFQNTGVEKSGTVVITIVAPANGKIGSKSITIMDKPQIDVVNLSAPTSTLKQNTAVILPVSIFDMNNKKIDLNDISFISNGNNLTLNSYTFMTVVGGLLSVEKDYVSGTTNIMLTPTAQYVVVTVSTHTGKVQTLNLTAYEASVPTYIQGVKSDLATILANDASLSTVLKDNIVFLDQYSEEIPVPVYKPVKANGMEPYYTIREKSFNSCTTFNAATGTIHSTPNAGTEVYIIELFDKDSKIIHTYEVTITVVDMKNVTSFGIKDLNKFYTDVSGAGTHNQTIEVYGLYGGKRVVVNQDMIMNISATNGLTGINTATRTYIPTNIDTKGEDRASELTVFVYNGLEIIPVTKNVVFSNAIPVAQALEIEYGGVKVSTDTVNIPYYELSNKSLIPFGAEAGRSKLQFKAKDQYGVQKTINNYKFVVTNNTTGGSVSPVGFASGYRAADSGKSFQLAVFVDNLFKSIKVGVV